ncbi:MAG: type II toxin-antitoxin system HicB family antitoxin [Acidobacteria bacterium]|jgi:predicted RNase H-like HicB family nuclease|nr:type II toxin-antitoxin system HicB family antitoxin [Acidobacteriota bacterium]
MTRTLSATIWREGDGFVALCSELDIASQGDSIEEARANLKEAVELFLETAHENEIAQRLNTEIYITTLEVNDGKAA